MHNKPELQLIADFRNGDGDAIAELFQRHYASSLRVARRILSARDEFVDAVEAAYLSGLRNFSFFRGESSFKTWTTKIVINECVMHLRNSSWQRRWVVWTILFPGQLLQCCRSGANARGSRTKRRDRQKVVEYSWQAFSTFSRYLFVSVIYGLSIAETAKALGPSYPPQRHGSSVPAPSCVPNSETCAVKRTQASQHQTAFFR